MQEVTAPFNHVTVQGSAGNSADDNKKQLEYFEKSERSRKIEHVQNGRYLYVYTMSTSTRKGPGETTFALKEIDLSSGKVNSVDSHNIVSKDNSRTGHITVSVGFSRRQGQKISPSKDKEIPRDEFLRNLK